MSVKISVRGLVEFILRSGDISDGTSGTLPVEAMNAGSRIHRKLQKMAGSYYDAEVPLEMTVNSLGYDITVNGRADGIIDIPAEKSKDGIRHVTIDEIKGVYRNVKEMSEPVMVHQAQAKCYAYFYASEQGLDAIDVQMTYVNLDSEEVKRFTETFAYEDLKAWYTALVDEMAKWVDFEITHGEARDESIDDLEFPFAYRKGQREMAACVYKSIEGRGHLFVQAPTGIGKTMAAMFPAIKAFKEKLNSKIFYLTAKTIAHTIPMNTIRLLRDRGLDVKAVVITAKDKICLAEERECNPEKCPYAKGHFDRINNALFELITKEDIIDRDTIIKYANDYMVCPFELCLDATLFSDIIVCDYNYVFDPRVNLKRFFANETGSQNEYTFLVDEAHNLVDRASSMYSAVLIKEDFLEIKKVIKKYSEKTSRKIDGCNRELLSLKKDLIGNDYNILPGLGNIYYKLASLHSALEVFLEDYKKIPERKDVLDFYFKIKTFLNIADLLDDNYVIYDEIMNDGRFMLKLFCVHPSENLKLCLDKGRATVFFSATILPVKYYMEMLSNSDKDKAIYIPSPFANENRRILIGTDVTTRYSKRSLKSYENIYDYIKQMVSEKEGNYMVFFPSYAMLNQVYEMALCDSAAASRHLIVQNSNMSEQDREDFLKVFDERNDVLAFCIMGGIFSEGIDLVGENLIGAAVVGPGLPQVCNERKIMMDFFNNAYSNEDVDGFKYAYVYPGINKVLQAAGRVIRTEDDRGVILLLDDRFGRNDYKNLFPIEWNDCKIVKRNTVSNELKDFWKGGN